MVLLLSKTQKSSETFLLGNVFTLPLKTHSVQLSLAFKLQIPKEIVPKVIS